MKIFAPTYTQTPNDLFDSWLPHLKEVELKVILVIMRKTLGWHKIRDRISISQLQKLTGSTATNIIISIDGLIEKGLITKEVVGEIGTQKTFYELVIHENSNNSYPCQSSSPPPANLRGGTPANLAGTKETAKKTNQKKQQQENAAVFFDSLKNVEIDEDEKVWLSKNYDEQTINHAIAYATNPNTKIKTSLIQAIKWACIKKPQIPTSKEEEAQKNKEFAIQVKNDSIIPLGCQFEVLNKMIEITFGGNSSCFVLEYLDSNFKEKFKDALRKYRIVPE